MLATRAMIVALSGQKGGAGKSTLAIALAAEGVARGLRVLLVDADPQATGRTWAATAAELGHPAPTVVAMDGTMHRPGQLDRVAAGADLVLIDCPPRLGAVQRSAMAVADLVLVPCGPTGADVWALAESVALVQEAQTLRPGLRAFVVVNKVQGRTAMGKGAREAAASAGLPVLRTALGQRVAYGESVTAGLGPTTYAPRDPAADEVRALFDEIVRTAKGEESRTNGKEKARGRRTQATAPVRKTVRR